jgi:hypothetical protein
VPTPTPEVTKEPDAFVTEEGYPRVSAWAISMIFLLLGSAMFYVLALRFVKPTPALRWSLGMLLGGLFVYNLLAFGVFNLPAWLTGAGVNGVIYATLFGGVLGWVGGWLWSRMGK